MTRGYQVGEIRQRLVDLLHDSKTGFSGIEIAEKLGINRVTITKYLNIFAAEGLIKQKNFGNVILWFVEEGIEQFSFPDDYFQVKTKYLESLIACSEQQINNLVRNCIHSGVDTVKMMTEIILPAIESIQELYQEGKIGKSEHKLIDGIISRSIQIINFMEKKSNPKKNVIVISAEPKSALIAEAASASFHSDGWQVWLLGDMSDSIDVLFDLDIQKFLSKIWKQKTGLMIIIVFSNSEEKLKFFSEAVNSVKEKIGKKLYLILCGKMKKKFGSKADLFTSNFEDALQWSQTTFESSSKKWAE